MQRRFSRRETRSRAAHRIKRWLTVLGVGLGLNFCSLAVDVGTARAQDDSAVTFSAAKKLFEAKSYAKALPLFQDAHAQTKSPNARVYVARCLRELGRFAEAYDEMSGTVRDATARAVDDPKYAPTRDSAAAELALLEPHVGKLFVAVADPPPGLEVFVNGQRLDAAKLGSVNAITPGKVTVEGRAPGRPAAKRQEDVAAGQTKTVTLSFGNTPGASAATSVPDGSSEPGTATEDSAGGQFLGPVRVGGLVVGALGVGGLVAFAVTGSMASSEFDALDAECGGVRCPAEYADRVAKGRTLTIVADVTAGVGGAALLAGTLMFIFGGEATPDSTAAHSVRPVIGGGPHGASVGACLHF